MNIEQHFRILEIHAGGPGSGPNAPCPQCGPTHSGKGDQTHKLEEGDTVRLKVPVKLYNHKNGNIDSIPGAKATVVSVLPQVGHADQMVKVQVISPSKNHENDYMQYMKMKDIELHNPKGVSDLDRPDTKPVPKSQVALKFKTSDGADVTWIKPHEEGEHNPKSLEQLSQTGHYLKGQFAQIDVVKGIQDRPGYSRVTRMYDTSNLPAYHQSGSGASIWVDSYIKKGAIKNVVVSEQNYTKYALKTRGVLTFEYKNAAKAVGMLSTRYGIKTTLNRLRTKK